MTTHLDAPLSKFYTKFCAWHVPPWITRQLRIKSGLHNIENHSTEKKFMMDFCSNLSMYMFDHVCQDYAALPPYLPAYITLAKMSCILDICNPCEDPMTPHTCLLPFTVDSESLFKGLVSTRISLLLKTKCQNQPLYFHWCLLNLEIWFGRASKTLHQQGAGLRNR